MNPQLHWAQSSPHASALAVAVDAVRQAAQLCKSVQQEITPETLEKKDRSPVTVADFGSQALICRALGQALPTDPVIGEEDAAALREPDNRDLLSRLVDLVGQIIPHCDADQVCQWIDRGGANQTVSRFWTLDPIDGTKGFLRRQQYAIALALIVEGNVELAVLGCPNLGPRLTGSSEGGSLFCALRDLGTYQLPLAGDGGATRVGVSPQSDPRQIRFCESVEKAHSSHDDAARVAQTLQIQAGSVRLDSQTKYAAVARGDAEAYLRLPKNAEYREKIWDHAAGLLVATEAGGRVTDIAGNPLDFSHGRTLVSNRGVVVTNGQLHGQIIGAIEDLGIARKWF